MSKHDYIPTTDGKAIVPDLCTVPVTLVHGEPEPCLIEQPCPAHNPLNIDRPGAKHIAVLAALVARQPFDSEVHEAWMALRSGMVAAVDLAARVAALEEALKTVLDIYDSVPGEADFGWHWAKVRDVARDALTQEAQQ